VNLIRQKMIPALGMLLTLLFEIRTGQAGRQLLEKIPFDLIGAMGFGNEPTIHGRLAVRRAEYFGAGQRLPAVFPVGRAPAVKLDFDQMIF
jgi:hypothetical protein